MLNELNDSYTREEVEGIHLLLMTLNLLRAGNSFYEDIFDTKLSG